MRGEPIDDEWSRFADDSGSLDVPRAEMPQIKAEHRGAMVNFLNARDIAHEEVTVPASSLKPTQAEFSPGKVAKAKQYEGGDRAILVSNDGHILDGHHQWLAKRDAGEDVRAIKLDAPIRDLLDVVPEMPSATTADGVSADRGSASPSTPVTAPSRATVTDQPSGKSIIVRGASAEQIAAIRTAIPNVKPLEPKSGGIVFSKKYQAKIEAVLARTGPARPELGQTFADPENDAAKFAMLRAANEGRGNSVGYGGKKWLVREGMARLDARGRLIMELTDKGRAELVRVDPNLTDKAAPEVETPTPSREGRTAGGGETPSPPSSANSDDDSVTLIVQPLRGGPARELKLPRNQPSRVADEDVRLTPSERAALEHVTSPSGWSKDSSAANQARAILEAGETRDQNDEDLLVSAIRTRDANKPTKPASANSPPLAGATSTGAAERSSAPVSSEPVSNRDELPAQIAPTALDGSAINIRETGKTDTAVTATGREIPVKYALVEADDLVTSNDESGNRNPDYPSDLQPRDRARVASAAQISEIAARFRPSLLGPSPKASDGAPIITPQGVVISGNGRSIAIKTIYANETPQASEYRAWLTEQGYDIGDMTAPVLVRVLEDMPRAALQAIARDANVSDTARMSSTEQAMADAEALTDITLGLYRGGDIDAAVNRDFVRSFMGSVVASSETGGMIGADGALSQSANNRIRAALLARAYGNAELIVKVTEATDSNIKALGNALTEVSGDWANLVEAVKRGDVAANMDITANINEAVALIDRARREGSPLADLLGQREMFGPATVAPETVAVLRILFARPDFTKPYSQKRMVDALLYYVQQAGLASGAPDLLGASTRAQPVDILTLARNRIDDAPQSETDLFRTDAGAGNSDTARADVASPAERVRQSVRLPVGDGGRSGGAELQADSSEQSAQDVETADDLPPAPTKTAEPLYDEDDPERLIGWFEPATGDVTMLEKPRAVSVVGSQSRTGGGAETDPASKAHPDAKNLDQSFNASNTEPVATLTGEEIGPTPTDGPFKMKLMRSRAYEWYAANLAGKITKTADGREVRFSKGGGKKTVSAKGENLLQAVPAIKAIVERGVVSAEMPGDRPDILKIQWITGRVSIGGATGSYSVMVREHREGWLHYDLTNAPMPGAQSRTDGATSETLGDPAKEGAPSEINLFQLVEKSNNATQDVAELQNELTARLKGYGIADSIALKVSTEWAGRVAGQYDERTITVLTNAAQDPNFTLDHEVVHALEDLGAFLPPEMRAMEKAARGDAALMADIKERYPDLSEANQLREAMADRFAQWRAGRAEKGLVARAFERIRDVIKAIGQVLVGRGATTEGGVFRAIERGDAGNRSTATQPDAASRASLSQNDTFAAEIMTELASVDDLFAYPTAQSTDLATVMTEISPDVRLFRTFGETDDLTGTAFEGELDKAGADRVHVFEAESGRRFFVFEGGGNVWLDVSRLQEGEGGSGLYAAVADYAFNTGQVFIGDPAGLSDTALRRRTEAMLSSALKHGTTDHLEPHPYQTKGNRALGVPPLKWAKGDTLGNVQSMIDVSIASMLNAVPQIRDARFDASTGTFRTGEGKPASDGVIRQWVDEARRSGATSAGSRSLKRAILLHTLLRAGSAERSRLLAAVLRQPGQLVGPQLKKTFYSRTGPPSTPGPFSREATDPTQTASAVLFEDASDTASPAPSKDDAAGSRFDQFRTAMQDRMLPVLRVQTAIEAALGRPLTEGENPYLTEELMTGKIGAQVERLADDMVEPLYEAMRAADVSSDDLETYLYARHAPERNARIASINPEFSDGEGSGMTDAEAAAIMAAVEASPKAEAVKALAARVDAILTMAVDTRVEAGLLSADDAALWRSTYKHYVPLRGKGELDPTSRAAIPVGRSSGISVKGNESRRAFGRKSRAADILPYAIMQAEEAIQRAEMNRVAQSFLELTKASPDKAFWQVDKIERRAVFNKATGQVSYQAQSRIAAEDAPYTVSVKVDGVEHRVTLNRDNASAVRVADAMRNLSAQQFNVIVKYLGVFTRLFSRLNTTFNPEFVITNALRDIQTAGLVLNQHDLKGLVSGTIRDWRKGLTAPTDGTGEWGKWRREFELAGGKVFFLDRGDLASIRDRLNKLATRDDTLTLKMIGRNTLGLIDRVNDRIENAVRLSAYKNAREAGATKAQAASIARNVTVNFTSHGQFGPLMNSGYAFFNAAVQGSVTLLIAAHRSKKVRGALAGIVLLGFLSDLLNRWASDDDDDGESFWAKVPDHDKEKNLIVMLPGQRDVSVKIPLGLGLNAFFSLGRNISEIFHGRDALTTGAEAISTSVDAFNPLGSDKLLTALLPTALDPVAELYTNRNFANSPIQPDAKPFGFQAPASERYKDSASTISKEIAQRLNAATGGDAVVPGKVSISPNVLDYLYGFFTGGAGRFVSNTANLAAAPFDPERTITLGDIPFVRKVVGSKPEWLDTGLFYDRMNQVEQEISSAKEYRKRGDEASMTSYLDAHPWVAPLESTVKEVRKELRAIGKMKGQNELWHDTGQIDAAGYAANVKQIKAQRDTLVAAFNQRWNDQLKGNEFSR